MKVNWFEVRNFRSIVDSGRCYLSPEISILAGKNESGKTNILRALECFSKDNFKDSDSPQDNRSLCPEVTISFELTSKELQSIVMHSNNTALNYELIIRRNRDYADELSGTAYEAVTNQMQSSVSNLKQDLIKKVNTLYKKIDNKETLEDSDNSIDIVAKIKGKTNEIKLSLETLTSDELKEEMNREITEILTKIGKLEEEMAELNKYNMSLIKLIPNFVLFDSFDNMLPDHTTAELYKESIIVQRLFKVAKLDPDNIFKETDGQIRKQIADQISAIISGDFGNYYMQSNVKLKMNLDGLNLYFFIYDDEMTPFKPEQRSKGFQWFLSFFLTLNAEGTANSIILIDEPGLYLHAKAQEDILKVMENISTNNQVIFTTHSPYLISPDRLDRVRLVLKNVDNHTIIENKIHKGADKDTLTPIITAIGLDLTKSLTFSAGMNVLVEGMSDYYYIIAMKKYLASKYPIKEDVNYVPNIGADQIPNIVALMIGWELNFSVILDNDEKGISVSKRLKKEFALEEDKLIFVHPENKNSIEDLFSKSDFMEYITKGDYSGPEASNSKIAKSFNKILIAKEFCSQIYQDNTTIKLSEETIGNFINLFKRIKF